jgi:hypothetical protein
VSVVVGHAQDADRELSEGLGAYPVALAPGRVIVDAAVELEDEALRRAMKVDDETRDELLAPELEAEDGAVAEDLPSGCLGVGRRLAKASGEPETTTRRSRRATRGSPCRTTRVAAATSRR